MNYNKFINIDINLIMINPLKNQIIIDGLQYCNWNREIFEDLRNGDVTAVHATLVYWENTEESFDKISEWKKLFIDNADIITHAQSTQDIINAKNVAEGSKRTYLSILKRVEADGFKIPTGKSEMINRIKDYIGNLEKTTQKLDVLNIIITIRNELDVTSDKIKELRDTFRKKRVTDNVEVMNDLKDKLMSLSEFDDRLQTMFDNKEYANFVVNYLFRNFGVRNKDVDVTILKRKKDMDDANYLWIRPKSVTYLRKDYKTKSSYGEKKYEITDNQFRIAVRKLGPGPILKTGLLTNVLKKVIIAKESDVFKMLIDDAYSRQDWEEIKRLSEARGTNIKTISENYHVNADGNDKI